MSAATASGAGRGDGVRCVPTKRVRPRLHFWVRVTQPMRFASCAAAVERIASLATHLRRAAYGQQIDLQPEIFASSVARRAFQATPLRMREDSYLSAGLPC